MGVVAASDDGHVRLYSQGLTKVYWERRLNSGVYASLVVDPERQRVVVAGTSGLVLCFDLRGGLAWSADVGAPVFATPTVLSAAGLLVIAAFHGRCLGLDLETGARVFDTRTPEPWHAVHGGTAAYRDPYASPVGTPEGNAALCCAEHVLCLAPDGTELWRRETGHAMKASPAALWETGEIAVCPVDGRCLFLDSRTGEPRGEIFLGAKITGSPAVSGGLLAVGTVRDTVSAIDIRTRRVIWEASQGAPRSYTSFSVLPGGNFIATAADGNIVCLRREDGRFLWESSQVLGLADHQPAMDVTPVAGPDGRMYGASYEGDLYEFRFQPQLSRNH
ncbi:PQQ-binding-like beta-propeller repeat protein [Streptomyces sp. NPDC056347]|uniref:outer membrane protein assembly factor BamB family protein n=1 Tax=Streptomyces sp. NPDC056347 TaxID=3345790 RepID=UPI0035E30CE2